MKNRALLSAVLVVIFAAFLSSLAYSQQVVGHIPLKSSQKTGGLGSTPVANPSNNEIYVEDPFDPNFVQAASGTTRKVVAEIPVGTGPGQVVVNPNTNTVYASYVSGPQLAIAVIDGATDQVVATIPPPPGSTCPATMAVDIVANQIIWTDFCWKWAYVIDGSTYQVLGTVPVPATSAGGESEVNSTTHMLYTGDQHQFIVTDLTNGTATIVPLPNSWPGAIAIEEAINRIFIGDNVLEQVYVIDGNTNALIATLKPPYVFDVKVNSKRHELAVSDGGQNIYFYHDEDLTPDGQATLTGNVKWLSLTVNPNNNRYYAGVYPPNALAIVVGPTQ